MLKGYQAQSKEHAALFIFGDSLFDAGNNNYINTTSLYQSNFWPYGISYFNPPSGRFSNGRIIPDFIAEYARLPLIPAYLDIARYNDFVYGANFASGGAGEFVETNAGFVLDLKTQLEYFNDLANHFRQKLGDEKAGHLLSNAVYLFSCGSNDYSGLVGNNYTVDINLYTHEQYVEMVIGNLTDVFMGIYQNGGRKFGIMTLPTMGCLPSTRAGRPNITCNEELNAISDLHNQKASEKLKDLEKQLDGFMYAIFDYRSELYNRMTNPTNYGFKVGESACCGSGPLRGIYSCGGKREYGDFEMCDEISEYLFFDSNHPTEIAVRQLADLFWNGDSNVTAPYNLKALFGVKRSPIEQV